VYESRHVAKLYRQTHGRNVVICSAGDSAGCQCMFVDMLWNVKFTIYKQMAASDLFFYTCGWESKFDGEEVA